MMEEDDKRIEIGVGAAKGNDAYDTGKAAAGQAAAGIRNNPVSIVLVYASVAYDLTEMLHGVSDVAGDVPVAGTTTAGELCNGILNESVVVVIIASRDVRVSCGVGNNVSAGWKRALDTALLCPAIRGFFDYNESFPHDSLREGFAPFIMLFSPGNTRTSPSCSYEILEEIKNRTLGRIPVFGGSSADDWRMEANSVFMGREVHRDSILVVVFETRLRLGISTAHGYRPTAVRLKATRTDGREVKELDCEPAIDVLARLCDSSRETLRNEHVTLATGLVLGASSPMGQYRINVASYVSPSGGVFFTHPVPAGSELTVMTPDVSDRTAAGNEVLRKSSLRGNITKPALVLVSYCALRPRLLGKHAEDEIRFMTDLLPGTPLAGFLSFGEQGLGDDGTSCHNNMVVSALILGDELSQYATVAVENNILRAESEKYSTVIAIMNSITDLAWLKDDKSNFITVNEAFCCFYGIAAPDAIGKTDVDIFPGPRALGNMSTDAEVMKTETRRYFEELIKLDNGNDVWLETEVTPVYDDRGKITGTVGIARDITDFKKKNIELENMASHLNRELEARKQAEIMLQSQRDLLETTLASIGDGVIVTDTAAIITFMNPAAEELTGWRMEEASGLHIGEVFKIVNEETKKEARNPVLRVLEEGIIVGFANHTCLIARDGRTIPIGDSGAPIKNRDGRTEGVILVFRDMTRKVQANKKLRETQAQLIQSEKLASIGQLAAGIAHEINNPLGYIISNTDTLSRYIEKIRRALELYHSTLDRETVRAKEKEMGITGILEDVDAILSDNKEGIFRIRDIVKSLKNFASVESEGKKEFSDLNAAVLNTLLIAENEIKYVATVHTDYGDIPPVYCTINEISQVLLNLLINAAHAIKEKKKSKLGLISVKTFDDKTHTGYAVSDDGNGIPESIKRRIFEPFFTTKEPGIGTGLGLSIAHDIIVNKHGGEISVESEEGKGSTFTVKLPKKTQ